MSHDTQHFLVHARELAQTAAQLYRTADDLSGSDAKKGLRRTAGKLLDRADLLMEDGA